MENHLNLKIGSTYKFIYERRTFYLTIEKMSRAVFVGAHVPLIESLDKPLFDKYATEREPVLVFYGKSDDCYLGSMWFSFYYMDDDSDNNATKIGEEQVVLFLDDDDKGRQLFCSGNNLWQINPDPTIFNYGQDFPELEFPRKPTGEVCKKCKKDMDMFQKINLKHVYNSEVQVVCNCSMYCDWFPWYHYQRKSILEKRQNTLKYIWSCKKEEKSFEWRARNFPMSF